MPPRPRAVLPRLLILLALPGAAAAGPLVGDPAVGRAWSEDNVCKECHNPDGHSTVGEYPRLGGQHGAYLLKQLQDFRDGRRKHAIMQALTQGLADRELADVAAHFAAQPAMGGAGRAGHPLGQRLFEAGDAERSIPACAGCHGLDAQGQVTAEVAAPALGGQHRYYLRGQLQDWRSGMRRNSPEGVMNAAARGLGDADIEALAEYLAGLGTP